MRKTTGLFAASGLAVAGLALTAGVQAQTIDNNFSRDHAVSVADRQHPEFKPLGLNLGAFAVNPTVEAGLGYNDNILYTQSNETSAALIRIAPAVSGATTWSRHALSFKLGAVSDAYSDASTENTTSWNASINGRLDINSSASLNGGLSHNRTYESRASYISNPLAEKPVPIDIDVVSIGTTLVSNRVKFVGGLRNQTENYHTVNSTAGGTISQDYRDLKTTAESGRIDYAVSPSFALFVAGEANQRRYDLSSLNDSDGYFLAVGTSFEIGALARGDIQLGTISQDYKNLTSGKLTSGYAHAKVEWFPTQITTVTGLLDRGYYENPTSGATSSGVLTTNAGVTVDHELLRNLLVTGNYTHISYDFRNGDRTDTSDTLSASGRYSISRRVALVARLSHQKYDSSGLNAIRSFDDNALLLSAVLSY
jgi:hypothetical protein